MEPEYCKSCVYEITWKETIYYVGSTKNFQKRNSSHKNDYKNENSEKYNKPLYKFIRDNGGWTNEWKMIIILSYPDCKSRRELLRYEREHYEIRKPIFNKCRPIVLDGEQSEIDRQYRLENAENIRENKKLYRLENAEKIKESKKLYREENAEKIKESKKLYREENAEIITEKNKLYREENAEKIKESKKLYREENAEKIRENNKLYKLENAEKIKENSRLYYEENAEKIKESKKLYREENAEIITEKNKLYREENAEKINKVYVCACGANYTHNHESRHKKSKKHQKFVEEQKNNVK
jgi:hypothetical protein